MNNDENPTNRNSNQEDRTDQVNDRALRSNGDFIIIIIGNDVVSTVVVVMCVRVVWCEMVGSNSQEATRTNVDPVTFLWPNTFPNLNTRLSPPSPPTVCLLGNRVYPVIMAETNEATVVLRDKFFVAKCSDVKNPSVQCQTVRVDWHLNTHTDPHTHKNHQVLSIPVCSCCCLVVCHDVMAPHQP